jgi:hypothetical protein
MGAAQNIAGQPLPHIAYAPRPDATPEAEIATLAACYRIILDSQSKKDRHLDKDDPNDGTGTKGVSTNAPRLSD